MNAIFLSDPIQHAPQIREIFWEYLFWANKEITAAYVEYQKYWVFMER